MGVSLFSQENKENIENTPVKTGWNFGLLPAISFDSDLGFQYGGLVNFFDYSDGSNYPNYDHSLYVEASRFTKGSGIYRIMYDSEKLFEAFQITTDLSYLPDQAYSFHGFNGYESVYNSSWIDQDDSEYKSRMFYKYDRKYFRFKTDLQGKIPNSKFKWIVGLNLFNIDISSVDIEKLNEGKDDSDKLPTIEEQPGLYEKYIEWGLIKQSEKNGGFLPQLKLGVVYDTRDNKSNPNKGMWTEATVVNTSNIYGSDADYTKISFIHRQYFPILANKLTFAYRINYQQTLTGEVPFYAQNFVITSILRGAYSEGLGGGKTLRGITRNRIVGDGFTFGNAELRWKAIHFKFINQNFYLGINAFYDFGVVTSKIDVDEKIEALNWQTEADKQDYFNMGNEKLHSGIGVGLRVAMNENFIVAIDYGSALDEQDGNSGIYIGLNYLF